MDFEARARQATYGTYRIPGQYSSPVFLFKRHNVSETGFHLLLHGEHTKLGPIEKAVISLR
jgi:hypothetical protein